MTWHDIQFAIADALEDERERRDLTIAAWLDLIETHKNTYEYLRNGTREVKLSNLLDMLERAGLELSATVGPAK